MSDAKDIKQCKTNAPAQPQQGLKIQCRLAFGLYSILNTLKLNAISPRQPHKNSKKYMFNTRTKSGLVMDYEATVKYLKCLFPKVSSEELCWAYIESDGDIDRAAGLILDGQYIAVKLQRAQDALHRHETDEAKECSANKSLTKECPSEGSSIYEDVPESPGSRLAKAKGHKVRHPSLPLCRIWFRKDQTHTPTSLHVILVMACRSRLSHSPGGVVLGWIGGF
ncbi:hypothetical protein ANCDUO_00323 [Ancylostoma duodenale]|uniref:CUE domain-containing protein n=1 Tax=Ancylostoma duodenale TaxID=51022 RepID=A0A0C2E1S8_9BILA|nr:hypothetical protein ANCDUO_00323 [Ancylostoma duodenale]